MWPETYYFVSKNVVGFKKPVQPRVNHSFHKFSQHACGGDRCIVVKVARVFALFSIGITMAIFHWVGTRLVSHILLNSVKKITLTFGPILIRNSPPGDFLDFSCFIAALSWEELNGSVSILCGIAVSSLISSNFVTRFLISLEEFLTKEFFFCLWE